MRTLLSCVTASILLLDTVLVVRLCVLRVRYEDTNESSAKHDQSQWVAYIANTVAPKMRVNLLHTHTHTQLLRRNALLASGYPLR
jgi:hypothetical protein